MTKFRSRESGLIERLRVPEREMPEVLVGRTLHRCAREQIERAAQDLFEFLLECDELKAHVDLGPEGDEEIEDALRTRIARDEIA